MWCLEMLKKGNKARVEAGSLFHDGVFIAGEGEENFHLFEWPVLHNESIVFLLQSQ